MVNIIPNYEGPINEELLDILQFLDVDVLGVEAKLDSLPTDLGKTDVISRITLIEGNNVNRNKILSKLNEIRQSYEYIVVHPRSRSLSSVVARDNRVDAIRITSAASLAIFNTRYSRRIEENNKLVELDISSMFRVNIAKYLRSILRVLQTFRQSEINFILTNLPSHKNHLRSYRGLQAIGRELGLSNKMTSPIPFIRRIRRNRKKLEGKIPFPGVEINGSKN